MNMSEKQLEIKEIDGRTQIVFKKAQLKGKVSAGEVQNAILIAARMQVEKYIDKLSRGAPLDTAEIKALKELSEIAKMTPTEAPPSLVGSNAPELEAVKTTLYQALAAKLSKDG